jgi:hypothetical protein
MRPTSGAHTQLTWIAAFACAGIGCAEAPARPEKYPGTSQTLCQYVGLESVETPQYSDRDSISLLAVYRFREKGTPPPKEPLTVKFQVNRSRVNELRSHLESQPEVLCTPDRDAHYHVQVKPFEVTPAPEPTVVAPLAPVIAAPDAGP